MEELVRRRAARVVCFAPGGRVLLMSWRDPVSGRVILEPPGGGIEPGELAIDAARRELTEEVGLCPSLTEDWALDCERDCRWAGQRLLASERFYGAEVVRELVPDPTAFTATEVATYLGAHWLAPADLATPSRLPGELEPPDLGALVGTLAAMRAAPARPSHAR